MPLIRRGGKRIPPVMVRMDFGCCLGNTLNKNKYFLNEMENQACNYFATSNKYPKMNVNKVMNIYADAFYKNAKTLINQGF